MGHKRGLQASQASGVPSGRTIHPDVEHHVARRDGLMRAAARSPQIVIAQNLLKHGV
jgi:hypothetical protein